MGDRRSGTTGRRLDDSKLHWLKFYLDDWSTSYKVRMMGPIARAWYLELLILQWRDGYVPDSDDLLTRYLKQMPRDPTRLAHPEEDDENDYSAILKQVKECFEEIKPGQLVNIRMHVLRNQTLAEMKAKSEGAQRANAKRWLTSPDTDTDTELDTDKEKSKPLVANATPKRRNQLPEDYQPKEHHKTFADRLSVCLEDEFPKFCDHHRAKGNVMANWDLALNTWLRNAAGRYRSNGNGQRQSAFERVANESGKAD